MRYAFSLGILSNHEAEFYAVIHALIVCKEKFPDEILAFRSDSQLVVDAIEKNYIRKTWLVAKSLWQKR
jgi:ribonuclease HI